MRPRRAGTSTSGAPSPLGDDPKFFDQLPYTGSSQGSGYNPLYLFGYGLSYTTFGVTGLGDPERVRRRHADRHVHRVRRFSPSAEQAHLAR